MAEHFIENYSELKGIKRPAPRELARKVILDTVSFTYNLTGAIEGAFKKPRVQFLYIHHIFKDEEVLLRKLIEKLQVHHTFITHTEAVNRILKGEVDKPYISVSSDDGLKNNLRAASILSEYNISACFFVCPSMIGETDYKKIKAFSENQLHLPAVEFMNWDDINKLLKQGHEIGGHTMSHVNIAKCANPQLTHEINNCYVEIEKRCGSVKHFAYPYGRYFHFTREAKNLVFASGFQSCASAERGCHIAPAGYTIESEDLFLRRDHVILTWPMKHILFFMARNVQNAAIQNNYSPYDASRNNNKQ
jgi:peptidoglycan/xylan/chitin deacetylase (PgdA/CDA1 family)